MRTVLIAALMSACVITTASAADLPAPFSPQVFFGAKLEPPAGRVIHGWGQFSSLWNEGKSNDEQFLKDYESAVNLYRPAMLSFYVALERESVQDFCERYKKLAATRGPFVAQVGVYFRGFERDVGDGMRDPQILTLGDTLREVGNPVLLRVGYEFNNPWEPYDASGYIQAFRRVVSRLREVNADNIAMVWNATPTGFDGRSPLAWYPGDDVVDWWSVNLFWMEDFTNPKVASFLDSARAHRKPVLIGEASPVFKTPIPARMRGPSSDKEAAEWFGKLIELVRRRPEIKAVSLIAVDWRKWKSILPAWGWPDARLAQWPSARKEWRDALKDPRFINADELPAIYGHRATTSSTD